MIGAHSKDNGSPTSVAHKLDQTDSVVVRRDEFVVIDNAALGTLCEDVHGIGAARRAAAARLGGADACDAPPGAGGSVLPAMSFPSRRPLPEDKD